MKQKSKKFLCMLLALVMLIGLLPVTTLADSTEDEGETIWQLVTDASGLKAGDQVIIAATGYDKALGTNQKNNNRAAASVTKSPDGSVLTPAGNDVQVLSLETGKIEGTFALYTGSGYLYAASSSDNKLKTESTLSENSSWTIEITNGSASVVAQGSNKRNIMQYNPANDGLFSCYQSVQKSICLYKLANPTPGLSVSVTPSNGKTEQFAGKTVTWTVNVSNTGYLDLTNVIIKEAITSSSGESLSFVVENAPDNIHYNSATHTFTIDTLAFKTDVEFQVSFTSSVSQAGETLNNTVNVSASYLGGSIEDTAYSTPISLVARGDDFILVTDVSDLEAGDEIIIASMDADVAMSIYTGKSSGNRGKAEITKSQDNSRLLAVSDTVQILTLRESPVKSGTYFLFTGSKYLTAISSASNYLHAEDDKDLNSSWTIQITDSQTGSASITANGSYTRNKIQYNQSEEIFSCYAAGNTQKAICIYSRPSTGSEPEVPVGVTPLENGTKIVIYNPKYNKALSSSYNTYGYNKGTTVNMSADGKLSGYTSENVWIANLDEGSSTYTFSNIDGEMLSMGKEFTRTPLGGEFNEWRIIATETAGLYYIQNVIRDHYLRWVSTRYNDWSADGAILGGTYKAEFEQAFYVILPEPALSVSVTLKGSTPVVVGKTISWTVNVSNTGNVDLENIKVQDLVTLPDSVAPVVDTDALSGSGISYNKDTNEFTIAYLEAEDAVSFTVSYPTSETDLSKTIGNRVSVNAMYNETELTDSAESTTQVTLINPDFEFELVKNADELQSGDKIILVTKNNDYAAGKEWPVDADYYDKAVSITKSADESKCVTTSEKAKILILTVERINDDNGNVKFMFDTGSGYIYAFYNEEDFIGTKSLDQITTEWDRLVTQWAIEFSEDRAASIYNYQDDSLLPGYGEIGEGEDDFSHVGPMYLYGNSSSFGSSSWSGYLPFSICIYKLANTVPQSNLTVSLQVDTTDNSVVCGEEASWSIAVKNTGDTTLESIKVSGKLELDGIEVTAVPVEPLPDGVSYDAATNIFTISSLTRKRSETFKVSFQTSEDDLGKELAYFVAAECKTDNETTLTANDTADKVTVVAIRKTLTVNVDEPDRLGNISYGQDAVWNIIVTNTGNVTLTDITVDVTLLLSGGPVSEIPVLPLPEGVNYDEETGKFTLEALAAGGSTTIVVKYATTEADVGKMLSYSVLVQGMSGGTVVTAQRKSTFGISVISPLRVTKTASILCADRTIRWNIWVYNGGNVTLDNVKVKDLLTITDGDTTITPDVTFYGYSGAETGAVTYDRVTKEFTIRSLSRSTTIYVTYDLSAADLGKTVENSATATCTIGDITYTASGTTGKQEVVSPLSVSKRTYAPEAVMAGSPIKWEIMCWNHGKTDLTNITVTDLLELKDGESSSYPTVTYLNEESYISDTDSSNAGATITDNGDGTFTLSKLASNTYARIYVTYTPDEDNDVGKTIINTATVTDKSGVYRASSVCEGIQVLSPLKVKKYVSWSTGTDADFNTEVGEIRKSASAIFGPSYSEGCAAGSAVEWTIEITNNGRKPLTNLKVSDTLYFSDESTGTVSFVGSKNGLASYSEESGITISELPAGQTEYIYVAYQTDETDLGSWILNSVEVNGESESYQDSAVSAPVFIVKPLQVSKYIPSEPRAKQSASSESINTNTACYAVGSTIKWQIDVRNSSAEPMTNVIVSDTMTCSDGKKRTISVSETLPSGVSYIEGIGFVIETLPAHSTLHFYVTYTPTEDDIGVRLSNSVTVKDDNDHEDESESGTVVVAPMYIHKNVKNIGSELVNWSDPRPLKAEVGEKITWTILGYVYGSKRDIQISGHLTGSDGKMRQVTIENVSLKYSNDGYGEDNGVIILYNYSGKYEITVSYVVQESDVNVSLTNLAEAKDNKVTVYDEAEPVLIGDGFTVTYTDSVDNPVVFEDQETFGLPFGSRTPAFDTDGSGTPGTPSRYGYTFVGWKDMDTGEIYNESNPLPATVTRNATYEAQWESLTGTIVVHYVDEDGNQLADNVTGVGNVGERYDVMALTEVMTIAYNGKTYERIRVEGAALTGAYIDGQLEVTVVYRLKTDSIIDIVTPVKPQLNRQDHVAYIIGYPVDYITGKPTTVKSRQPVRPTGNITRAEVTTIFFRLLTDESRADFWCKTNDYIDVSADAWYNNAVSTMTNAGIVTGYPDGSFRPDAPITRAEFATMAVRFSEVTYNGGNSFTDVPSNHWAARYIALAEHLGWIKGYPDSSFKPDQAITRAEAMTLINRVLERAVEEDHMLPDMVKWPDNLPGTWYYADVQEATNSHEYTRLNKLVPGQDFCYEDWLVIKKVPKWADLEKTWSTVYAK